MLSWKQLRKSLANIRHMVCQVGWLTRLASWRWREMKPKEGFLVSKSKQSRERWRRLNSNLNESYKSDEAAMLNKQMEDLKIADSRGEYTSTWKIIHELYGKGKKTSVKVNKRDGTPPTSETDVLAEWRDYFSSLLNNRNSNSQSPSALPPPAAQDLRILTLSHMQNED